MISEINHSPKVSICMPTYNRAGCLKQALAALLNQTFSDFELVVCDDASTDNTEEVVKSINDKRLRYVRNPSNLGLFENWNNCIKHATGEYIAIYHDHDIYDPTLIEESVKILDSNERIGFIFTGIRFIDDNDNVLETIVEKYWDGLIPGHKLARFMATRWNSLIAALVVMVRRDAYETVGLYEPSFGSAADWEMWIRLLLKYDTYYIAKPMADVRARNDERLFNIYWKDIQGRVKMHKLNIERVYKHKSLRYIIEKIRWSLKRDKEYIKYVAWSIVKGKHALIREGKEIIENESLIITRILVYVILFNPASRPLLVAAIPVFHLFSWIRLLYYRRMVWRKG